jgi:hypothetical protein
MKTNKTSLLAIFSCLFLSACGALKPYEYQAKQDDPSITFVTSKKVVNVGFTVANVQDQCYQPYRAGSVYDRDTDNRNFLQNSMSGLFGSKEVKSFVVAAPANQPLLISGGASYQSGNIVYSCNTNLMSFTLEKNKKYTASYMWELGSCLVILTDDDEKDKTKFVKLVKNELPKCK